MARSQARTPQDLVDDVRQAFAAYRGLGRELIDDMILVLEDDRATIANLVESNAAMAAERDAARQPPEMTQAMIEAGIRAYGSDDARSSPERVLDIWLAMSGAAQPRFVRPKTCRFKRSDMTPCVITDGDICYSDDGHCVGCGRTKEQMAP